MHTQQVEGKRDLVLAPGEYAYLQDETRGMVKTYVGPTVINQTAQDRPVVFDPQSSNFRRCSLEQAVQKAPLASEGDYIVLENPADANSLHPDEGQSRPMPTLRTGRKVNLPGPTTFALWPGQKATVVKGHHLRSNQYLLVRVYNEQEARQNWGSAVAVRAEGETAAPLTTDAEALNLTIGKLLIIKGTEVSFYIPPTGVEVIAEGNNYVREAVTLERLEYAILISENGDKRYERGPQVVFPKPTETFFTENSVRKFKAIELNALQGLHVKVIADYDGNEVGDELFITGDDTPIYYPRVEHSIISYGDKKKHFATAIPAGEGRYVMERDTGVIRTERGPKMLLPDPRKEVVVRRILSDKQVVLWYPGNEEALAYNRSLRAVATEAESARSGFLSEGDIQKKFGSAVFASKTAEMHQLADVGHKNAPGADVFQRGTGYTQPRTVTLNTKYEGVPSVEVWTGYAVQVVSKTGNRKVVTGPATVLLEYDQSLEILELSTGKPKTTDKLEKTVYLRIANNKISDIVRVRTRDHVDVSLKLSYRVNFEGDSERWFAVENYVKFLCDHARSVLKGVSQKRLVEDFHNQGVDIIRSTILGEDEAGMLFEENGMRITDVEVLGIDVDDEIIADLLNKAQHEVVRSNIKLHQAQKELEVKKRQEQIAREASEAEHETALRKAELQASLISKTLTVSLERIRGELEAAQQQKEADQAKEAVKDVASQSELQRQQARKDQDLTNTQALQVLKLEEVKANTEAMVARFTAAQQGFSEALLQLQSQETLTKVAEALSVQRLIGGNSVAEVIQGLFVGSGLEGLLDKVQERMKQQVGNHH
jgi:major vault protein